MPISLTADLRSAIRHARRRPLFAVAVAGTLAATIAAAATTFGLAASVLWRPLPFDDHSRLVFVWESVPGRDGQTRPSRVTGARYAAWRDASLSTASIALFGAAGFTLEDPSGARSIAGLRVSARYFDTLGVRPALGRTFAAGDEQPGQDQVVVLSHAAWRERFGGRSDVIGQSLRLSGRPFTIIGVMPPIVFPAWPVNPAVVTLDAHFAEFWVPIPRTPALDQNAMSHVFGVLARLAPGVSLAQAEEQLRHATAGARDAHGTHLTPLRDQFVRDAQASLLLLAAAALAVLLIACANLAALYVSSFESRRVEFATRAAIGAGTWSLIRQLAAEALLLSAIGAAVGIGLAGAALGALPRWLPPTVPLLTLPSVDAQVVGFAVLLAALAGVLLTGWPVIRLVRTAPAPRGVAVPARASIYRLLVIGQVSITMALAFCAGLLAQSLRSVERENLGFAVDGRLVVDVGLPAAGPPSARTTAAAEQALLARVAALPGVSAVATAYDHPLESNWTESIRIRSDVSLAGETRSAELRIVSPGYFDALGVAVIDGRAFDDRDDVDAPGAMVVNQALAREVGDRVLGRRIGAAAPGYAYQNTVPNEFDVVGVVENERTRGPEHQAAPAVYLSTRQFPQPGFSLIVRTAGDPLSLVASLRAAIRAIDPAITVDRPEALDAILGDQLAERRVTADVTGVFALAALGLAALGLYGVLAVAVSSRTREIGVRLALGASPAMMAGRVLRDGVATAAAGVALGALLAIGAGRLISSLLVGVSAGDPLTVAGVAAAVLALAAAAAAAPARRAARTEALSALRE